MNSLDSILAPALTSFRELLGAPLGNIQLLDMDGSNAVLEIAAHHGFDQAFLDTFAKVSAGHGTACGRALQLGKTVVVSDVDTDADFAPFRAAAHAAGYRAVISTPVATRWHHNVGIISAHFAKPGRPDDAQIARAEALARDLAHAILNVTKASADARKAGSAPASSAPR